MKENRKLLKEVLKDIRHDMSDEEVLNLLADSKISVSPESEKEKYTLGQRAADVIAKFAGSWAFIFSFTGVLVLWMIVNTLLAAKAFDPYPFILLNLVLSCVAAIQAPLIIQKIYKASDRVGLEKKTHEMMDLVGLARRVANSYPHELDGGRRQRIGIARALALNPKFIVCDEPVSALDVSIQAQVLNLMQDLQQQLGLTYMFITHDLSVVKHLSSSIVVMYLGQMVEQGTPEQLFNDPRHPYTKALLSAIPIPDPEKKMERIQLNGELTSPINVGAGCRFAKRCLYAKPECSTQNPQLTEVEPGHFVSCIQCK